MNENAVVSDVASGGALRKRVGAKSSSRKKDGVGGLGLERGVEPSCAGRLENTTQEQLTCETCKFWKKVNSRDINSIGECRRFPPSFNGLQVVNSIIKKSGADEYEYVLDPTNFSSPTTVGDYWCGEHVLIP